MAREVLLVPWVFTSCAADMVHISTTISHAPWGYTLNPLLCDSRVVFSPMSDDTPRDASSAAYNERGPLNRTALNCDAPPFSLCPAPNDGAKMRASLHARATNPLPQPGLLW